MDKWHYDIGTLTIEDVLHPNILNELGDLSRELIAAEKHGKPQKWLVVFKKPLPKGIRSTEIQSRSLYNMH